MTTRLLAAVCLAAALILGWNSGVSAHGSDRAQIENLYVFGNSLSDSGNLFALTGDVEPPSPPYFNGRFSNGPVWVERLAELLGLAIDFDTTVLDDPQANNQAIGGAFTDTRNSNDALIPGEANAGILSQVANFAAAGGEIEHDDFVIVWGGAINYIFDLSSNPDDVVDDLVQAIEELTDLGARRFLVPNLPNLGDTPLQAFLPAGVPDFLNSLVQQHNAALAEAMAELGNHSGRVQIVELDINTAFTALLAGSVFEDVTNSCLIQVAPGFPRFPTGECNPDGPTFDATGKVFWDLIHPTTATHEIIALVAHAALTGAVGTLEEDDDDDTDDDTDDD